MDGQAARGSDDDYCSAYPPEPHAWVSHSVNAAPIRWVERCHLCGHISSKALREQLAKADAEPDRIEGGRERVYVMPVLPTPTQEAEYAEACRIAASLAAQPHAE